MDNWIPACVFSANRINKPENFNSTVTPKSRACVIRWTIRSSHGSVLIITSATEEDGDLHKIRLTNCKGQRDWVLLKASECKRDSVVLLQDKSSTSFVSWECGTKGPSKFPLLQNGFRSFKELYSMRISYGWWIGGAVMLFCMADVLFLAVIPSN